MNNYLVAVSQGEFTFTEDAVRDALLARWPGTTVEADPVPGSAVGLRFSLPADLHDGDVRVPHVDWSRHGRALDLEMIPEAAAQVLEVLAALPGLPDEDVVIIEWADDLVPLRPGATAGELSAACMDL